ncbi:hypothetical protein EC991_006935 [Linnemannia zychae]|nr:hypothetical protein EC991_006935 [Linnemannia zychae]
MTTQLYQTFQYGTSKHTFPVLKDHNRGEYYICLTDIQKVFPTAYQFRAGGTILLFMEDDDENWFEPKRIEYWPKMTIEIAAEGEEFPSVNPIALRSPPESQSGTSPTRAPHSLTSDNHSNTWTAQNPQVGSAFISTTTPVARKFDLPLSPTSPTLTGNDMHAAPIDDTTALKAIDLECTDGNLVLHSKQDIRGLFRALASGVSTLRKLDLTFDWVFGQEDLALLTHLLASTKISDIQLDLKEHIENVEYLNKIRTGRGIYQPLFSLFLNTQLQSVVLKNVYNLGERTTELVPILGSSALTTFHFRGFINEGDQIRLTNILLACPNITDLALGTHLTESDEMHSTLSRAISILHGLECLHLYSMDTDLAGDMDDDNTKDEAKDDYKFNVNDERRGATNNNNNNSRHQNNAANFNKFHHGYKHSSQTAKNRWYKSNNNNGTGYSSTSSTLHKTNKLSSKKFNSNNSNNNSISEGTNITDTKKTLDNKPTSQKLVEFVHTGYNINSKAISYMICKSAFKIKILMLPRLSESASDSDPALEITTTTFQNKYKDAATKAQPGQPNPFVASMALKNNNLAFAKLTHLDLSIKLSECSLALLASILPNQNLLHLGVNCDTVELLKFVRLLHLKSINLHTIPEDALEPLFDAVIGNGRECKIEYMRLERIWPIDHLNQLVYAISLRHLYLVNLSKTALEDVLQEVDLTNLELLVIDDEGYDWSTEAILVERMVEFSEKLIVRLGSKSTRTVAKRTRDVFDPEARSMKKTATALPRDRVEIVPSSQLYDQYIQSVLSNLS